LARLSRATRTEEKATIGNMPPIPPLRSSRDHLDDDVERSGWGDYVWAFHDDDEIGPRMLARIAKDTGLTPGDL
jgi:hypothetical protein